MIRLFPGLSVFLILCASCNSSVLGQANSEEQAASDVPKIVLVGDSIRLSYAPSVAKLLGDRAKVISPKPNGGDSSNVLRNLEEWVISEQPHIVHFNCGIHDTKKFHATGKFQVSPEAYEANLRKIVQRIRDETDAIVLFATTTPILDARAAKARQGRDYELLEASVAEYNLIATKVMKELEVPVNDLHTVLSKPEKPNTVESLISSDGVHLQLPARNLIAEQVADFLSKHLPAK